VLTELGVPLDDDTEVRVWDSSGHSRWFVVPTRPAGTDGWTEEQLAELVTTESMIGVALADQPTAA
jgi:nitrile hydratase